MRAFLFLPFWKSALQGLGDGVCSKLNLGILVGVPIGEGDKCSLKVGDSGHGLFGKVLGLSARGVDVLCRIMNRSFQTS